MKGEPSVNNLATIGVQLSPKSYQLSDGSAIDCHILDTGGQEKFFALNELYYKKSNAVLLVYDITDRNSFLTIQNYYMEKIKELCVKNIPIILLGNKTDLEKNRVISHEEGVVLALSYNIIFQETSCLKNENVADAFETLIELWNTEYKKKKSYMNRRNSGDDLLKPNKIKTRRKQTIYSHSEKEEDNSTIILKKEKIKKRKNRENCC
jgi:small GTP-binding protein